MRAYWSFFGWTWFFANWLFLRTQRYYIIDISHLARNLQPMRTICTVPKQLLPYLIPPLQTGELYQIETFINTFMVEKTILSAWMIEHVDGKWNYTARWWGFSRTTVLLGIAIRNRSLHRKYNFERQGNKVWCSLRKIVVTDPQHLVLVVGPELIAVGKRLQSSANAKPGDT